MDKRSASVKVGRLAATTRPIRRGRTQFRWLVASLGMNLLAIGVDRLALGENFALGLAARLLVVTPLFLAALALNRWSSHVALRGFMTAFATVAFAATIAMFAQVSQEAFAARYLMIASFYLFTSILFAGVGWFGTKIMAHVSIALFCVAAALDTHPQVLPLNIDLMVVTILLAQLALVIRKRQDRQMSDIFAMRELDAQRVAALDKANTRLAHLSNTDALTGLFNRRYLAQVMDDQGNLPAGNGRFAVIMLDIDHFKILNDHSGHAEGDRCLRLIAGTIAEHLKPDSDIAIRYGGEEFLLILRDIEASEAAASAERLRAAVAALCIPNRGLGPAGTITVSVGVHAAQTGDDLHLAIMKADMLLYKAKQGGRNRISAADGQLAERAA